MAETDALISVQSGVGVDDGVWWCAPLKNVLLAPAPDLRVGPLPSRPDLDALCDARLVDGLERLSAEQLPHLWA